MAQKINLVTLGVDDLDESILFYEDALGCTSMAQEGNVAIFNLSDSWLALLPKGALLEEDGSWNAPNRDNPMQSLTALSHHVDSKAKVDEAIAQAVDAGATLLKKPVEQPSGGYAGYFTDPEGHLWQVIWDPYYYNSLESRLEGGSLPN